MSFQFAHFSTFSRKGSVKARTAAAICREAARLEVSSPHVDNPLPPNLLFGVDPMEALAEMDRRIAAASATRSGRGRAIRQDTHTLGGIVVSHPATRADLADEQTRRAYEAWRDDAVRFLQADAGRHGMILLSVVEHLDESHLHLHGLYIASGGRCDMKTCHPGYAAHKAASGKKEAALAYVRAMREWQDQVYSELSARHGHARLGPKRRRLSRAAWQAEQAAARSIKKTMEQAAALEDAARRTHAEAKQELEQAALEAAELRRERLALEQDRRELQAVKVATEAFIAGEIVDAEIARRDQDSELVFNETLPEQRVEDLVTQISPGWSLATRLIRRMADATRRLPAAAMEWMRQQYREQLQMPRFTAEADSASSLPPNASYDVPAVSLDVLSP